MFTWFALSQIVYHRFEFWGTRLAYDKFNGTFLLGRHNLTLMFNAIETRDRLEEDAVEHGNDLPPEPETTDEKVAHM